MQNKGIYQNELEAWLAFLSEDDPEQILELLHQRPDFVPFYQHIYDMCRNVEKVMGMFSEELRLLDKNTVHYMIDDMQKLYHRRLFMFILIAFAYSVLPSIAGGLGISITAKEKNRTPTRIT